MKIRKLVITFLEILLLSTYHIYLQGHRSGIDVANDLTRLINYGDQKIADFQQWTDLARWLLDFQ